MYNIIAIFLGGGIGSVLRYLTNSFFNKYTIMNIHGILISTLLVNIIGSFIIGFVYSIFMVKVNVPMPIKLAITVGLCGGLTTFSTFSAESLNLLRTGEVLQGISYILISILSCILMVGLGIMAGNQALKLF